MDKFVWHRMTGEPQNQYNNHAAISYLFLLYFQLNRFQPVETWCFEA